MTTEGEQIDRSTLKALLLTNLPPDLRERSSILEVMSKYGDIQKVSFRDVDKAIVAFGKHGDAAFAKNALKKASPKYKQISIQWCSLQRTSSDNSPAGVKHKTNPFDTPDLFPNPPVRRSNPPSQEDFPALNSTPTGPKSATLSSPPSSSSSTFPQTKSLFGKRAPESSGATGNLFSRALQESTSSVAAPDKSSKGGSSSAEPFSQAKEPGPAAKIFAPRNDRFGSASVFGQQRAEGSAAPEGNLPNGMSGNLFAPTGPVTTLFGKPLPPQTTNASPKDNPSQGFGMFKKQQEPSSGGSSTNFSANALAPNAAVMKQPTTLFGKPVPAPTTEQEPSKVFSLPNKSKFLFSRPPGSDSSPKRGQNSALPPTKWLASAPVAKEPVARPLFGSKPDGTSAFANRVWVKNATASASATSPSKSIDSRGQLDMRGTFQTSALPELSTTPAPPPSASSMAPPKQSGMQTRTQTNPGLAKFNDLLTHSANTMRDRHKLLEMRDKILRELLSSQPQTGPMKGTCTDMCPEKERYHRGDRNLVDKYEMLQGAEGVMDPSRMVKEYQRSSADQEFPLPHELRAPTGLNLTMNYLIRFIISAQPSNGCGEWFTFIWNRTRAIRKDITQQEIEADPISTQILERCSRFHIHCAHALCGEDPHSFDPKLNNENLTKCLKSLKYSYNDLKLEGVRCTNEAEFVAYEILMNLNDAGIAKTITDLEPEIRAHSYVKFAISAMYALHAGNHVRFFNLVHCAPYLVACILHRFFTEVRVRAVSVLSKALNKSESVQLSTLTGDLYFNNENECSAFIANFGIEVDDQGMVSLKSFQHTDSRLEDILSRRISEKMGPSLAQVVYGPGEIPAHNYEPQDSFTSDGMFKRSSLNLPEQQTVPKLFAPAYEFQPPAPPPLKPREFTDRELQPQVDAVIDAVINEQLASLLKNVGDRQAVSLQILNSITDAAALDAAREVSTIVLEAERQADRRRRQQTLDAVCAEVTDDFLRRYTAIFTRDIAVEIRSKTVESVCTVISFSNQERILGDVIQCMVSQIARTEYELCSDAYRESLAKILRSTHLARRYLRKWKRWVIIQRGVRDFPAGPIIGKPKDYRGIKRRSPSHVRQLQLNWDAVRERTWAHEHSDRQPILIERIFRQLVKIVIISGGSPNALEKCRNFFRGDSSLRFCSEIPQSLSGSNVVVVFPRNDPDFVLRVRSISQQIRPAPVIGVVWNDCGPKLNVHGIEEVAWKAGESPLHDAMTKILTLLADKVPAEPKYEEATLRGFVRRGIEYCLSKVCASNKHLPTSVKLMNDIVNHLAAVASSENLLRVNSLRLEPGWNSKENLSSLHKQISVLRVPVPSSDHRLDFIRAVEADKQITLLTTKVNMKDFHSDFTFLGHIYNQLSYLLNCSTVVRYLQEDFENYGAPEFWFARPMLIPVVSTCSELRAPKEAEALQVEVMEPEQRPEARTQLAETKREVQELLRRSRRSRTLRALEPMSPLENPTSNGSETIVVKSKRKSCENSIERQQPTLGTRTSKQMKLAMTIEDLKRTVDRLKENRKFEKFLKGSGNKMDDGVV